MASADLSSVTPEQAHVASRIAKELGDAYRRGYPDGQLAKVTTVLHAFRTGSGSTEFATVEQALFGEGVEFDARFQDGDQFARTGIVRLKLIRPPDAECRTAVDRSASIRMSRWTADGPSPEQPLGSWGPNALGPLTGQLRWFDLDPIREAPAMAVAHGLTDEGPGIDHEDLERQVVRLLRELRPVLGAELTEDMVRDLLRPDPRLWPKVDTYGNEQGPRGLSVVAAIGSNRLPELNANTDGENRQPVSRAVVFQKVQMLVGPDWIVTCWPPSRTVTGGTEPRLAAPLLREPFLRRVHHLRSQNDQGVDGISGSDLGLSLALACVDTYGGTHRLMQDWVADWEVDFFARLRFGSLSDLRQAGQGLDALLATVAEARRRLVGLRHVRTDTQDRSWLPATARPGEERDPKERHAMADSLNDALEHHEKAFATQSEAIRADMDLAMLRSSAAQQAASEQIQSKLAMVTWFVLVPTLIAGLFGANTALPGGETWWGFGLMVFLMVLSVLTAAVALHYDQFSAWARHRLRRSRRDRL